MGREIESFVEKVGKVDISHQEIDRILKTVEEMYTETKANTPELEWMPVQGVGNLICHELGYEDMAEFEDAMRGSFHQFLSHFPVVEMQQDDRVTGGHVFRIKPDPPSDEWEPTKYTVDVREGQDLWRICHKSKWGRICVPCIEFEIQPDGQRHIDTLYSHIGSAITNLAMHCSSMGECHTKEKILETVEELTRLLDVAEPWKIVVMDPSGVSEVSPSTDVAIERYDPAAEAAEEEAEAERLAQATAAVSVQDE